MEGRRALVTEVQALVGATVAGSPRRTVSGLDHARLAMVLAVLQSRSGLRLHEREIFAATVGGIRVVEPAADLALALAVASAANDSPLAAGPGGDRRGRAHRRDPPGRRGPPAAGRGGPARLPVRAGAARAAARPAPDAIPAGMRVVEVPTVRAALHWAVQHSAKPPGD